MLVEWLRRHDACFMHCGAVALEGRTVMLSGPPGSGKSTQVLRMLQRGASFLADDLAILSREGAELWAYPFREVANVNAGTLQRFSGELGQLADSPLRGDGKHCVDIGRHFGQRAVTKAAPGVVLHLHPDAESWKRPRSAASTVWRGLPRGLTPTNGTSGS
jgi:serine kinase of HPr protein (carbohydrate metabolism regulator)